ncbi:hypothetical protein Tco_1296126, partial [Tanacetum coccineum]
MPPLVANKPYTKPPTKKQILAFIKTLGYDEDPNAQMTSVSTFVATKLYQPWRSILSVLNRSLIGKDTSWDTARLPVLQILYGIVYSANLDYASLIWDEFEWQAVDKTSRPTKMSKLIYTRFTKLIIDHFLSCNKSIPRRSDAEMHSEGQDSPLTKMINKVEGKFKFGMEIPDTMITDAIKQSAGYKYYKHKKDESEKGKVVEELEEQHMSPIRSGRGKGYMCLDVEVKLAKFVNIEEQLIQQHDTMTQLKTKRQVKKDVKDMYAAEWGLKLKGLAIEDAAFEDILVTDSDATRDSSCSDTDEKKNDETDDSDDLYMNLSDDEPKGDDDAAGFKVFMYYKLTELPKSTSFSPIVTCSSLEYIQNLLSKPPVHELIDLMSNLVYTDAHTTSAVANTKGNTEAIAQNFKEYDQKLEALSSIKVSETIKEAVQAKFLTEMKKQLPTYVPNAIAN